MKPVHVTGVDKNRKIIGFLFFFLLRVSVIPSMSQETIFSVLKNDLEKANTLFTNKQYPEALNVYLGLEKRKRGGKEIYYRIARCFFHLKDYQNAVHWYDRYPNKEALPPEDHYYLAESLCVLEDHAQALTWYEAYRQKRPDDERVQEKVWQINNMETLYEDSVHFAVRDVPINSPVGEFAPAWYDSGLVFVSNRSEARLVETVDAATNMPFYRLYYAKIVEDTSSATMIRYQQPVPFARELRARFHEGPVAFFNNGNEMVCSMTGETPSGENQQYKMQLYFAEKQNGNWKIKEAFPYNSAEYSISKPAINSDGTVLFFASDMPGGFGGEDLYKSVKKDGQWSEPVNLGDKINTDRDESYPFVHLDNTLHFSSNGHAGMGGLDIFSVSFFGDELGDVENMGYPVNSSWDDFGFFLNADGTTGYLSSNRGNNHRHDDIYEVYIDRQGYPMHVSGLLKFKEAVSAGSLKLKILPNAKLNLIDNFRNKVVCQSLSDSLGNYSMVVPYFSQYKIQVIETSGAETITSLDLPRFGKVDLYHEVVIVKKALQSEGE